MSIRMKSGVRALPASCVAVVLCALMGLGQARVPAAGAAESHANAATSWTVYHGDALGSGEDTSGVTFSPPNHAWTSPLLDGQIYGEPLEATGRVYVATENDTVYALAANTGAVLWSNHVGTPVPSSGTGNLLPAGRSSPWPTRTSAGRPTTSSSA